FRDRRQASKRRAARIIDQLARQLRRQSQKSDVIGDTVEQIARVHAAELAIGLFVVFFDEVIERVLVVFDLLLRADRLKDRLVLAGGRARRLDHVTDAAPECFVTQVARIEIGRENNQLLERHFDLLAGGKSQKVHLLFQRVNPAIQKLGRLY